MPYKILAVDDEIHILELIKDYFSVQGYLVYTAESGQEALKKMESKPDLILLDVNMPDMDGFEVCKQIRNHITCPILFLTAKVGEGDRVNGLMIGGDDYILKPFSILELGARVEAHLRRAERGSGKKEEVKFSNGLVIHYTERYLCCKEQKINLTRTEFELIEILSLNQGQIFSKERLYENLRGYDSEGDSSIITEHIRRIRQKIGACSENAYIETIWGVGYKWIG